MPAPRLRGLVGRHSRDAALAGVLQVASFHPGYRFEGTAPDDVANFTNRSPHPMLHLLREDSIARAVAALPDAAAIDRSPGPAHLGEERSRPYNAHIQCAGTTNMLRFDDAPKRPANLSLNSRVLDLARELGMNLSQTVDALLEEEVRRRLRERWLERNQSAIEAYNARIEREGTFAQQIQKWLEDDPDGPA